MIRRLPSFLTPSRESPAHPDDSNAIPPPPYTDSSTSPFLLAETRTTQTQVITATTETTTHVLPAVQHYSGAYLMQSAADVRRDLNHGAGSPGFLALDKALPPTPRSASISFDSPRSSMSQDLRSSGHSSPSISQLGLTSLSVCLPPLHNQPTLSASTPLPFPSLTSELDRIPPQTARKSKSTQRLRQPKQSHPNESQRSRGVSFGAASWLALATATVDGKGKGKERVRDKSIDMSSTAQPLSGPPKSLSRKSSFWSRQKNTAPDSIMPPEGKEAGTPITSPLSPQVPALPQLNFVCGLDLDEPNDSPSPSRSSRPLSIARRHSDYPLLSPAKAEFAPSTPLNLLAAADNSNALNSANLNSPSISPSSSTAGELGHTVINNRPTLRPPRPRSQTNPPLLHRLSTAFFSSIDNFLDQPSANHTIPYTSPRKVPKPSETTESPSVYVSRLRSVVSKAEMAGILASSSSPFYVEALRHYLHQFDFHDEPLDIALRKLLMEVGLPRETQQIDRVMEAFSSRYSECNPGLFASGDHGYVLAFSLIMLHTDAFNPSNKHKMTKPDYIKNTSLAGLPSEVLGCYYDNIVFAPFIFIEDPLDINGQVDLFPNSTTNPRTPSTPPSTSLLGKNKIDPYYLISNNSLQSMRKDVEAYVPLADPFSYCDVGSHLWSNEELQQSFSSAGIIEVEPSQHARPPFATSVGDESVPVDFGSGVSDPESSASSFPMTIRVTKIGVLNRKDDIGPKGRRNTFRKWRSWSVLLTGSQLLFFRDASLAEQIINRLESTSLEEASPGGNLLKPDEILTVNDAIAVYDKTYKKHKHTFRFILSNGRQILLQTQNTDDMGEWLAKINYASAFKSAGVRIRPLGMSPDEIQMTGVAAATSLLHDAQYTMAPPAAPIQPWDSSISHDLMGMLSADSFTHRPVNKHRLTIAPSQEVDLDNVFVETATSQQFETTFMRVKANLAQDTPSQNGERISIEPPPGSPLVASSVPPLTRSGIIRLKIDELETKVTATQSQLDAELRFARNIAILKPFQRATRARLLNPVQNVARKVMLLRLEAVRLECHLSVLRQDLELECRSLDEMQSVALDAAKRSLDRGSDAIPRMTVSLHDAETQMPPPPFSPRSWSNSSTSESFLSIIEHRTDWPVEESNAIPVSLALSHLFDSPRPSLSAPTLSPNESRSSVLERSASYSNSIGSPPSFIHDDEVAEIAEAWNKTRCAQRVSLIRVPSTVSFSHRLDGRN